MTTLAQGDMGRFAFIGFPLFVVSGRTAGPDPELAP